MKTDKTDAQIIDELGGPAKVAELLHLEEGGAVQRVYNWKKRGIPASVRLAHLDLFGHQCKKSKTRESA